MTKPTLFDIIADRVIWSCEHCNHCDGDLDLDTDAADDQVVIRAYRGGRGHLVMLGYHSGCWQQNREMMNQLSQITSSI